MSTISGGKGTRVEGIHYVDVGTKRWRVGSGTSYCMMIGGETEVVNRLDPIFGGWRRDGPTFHYAGTRKRPKHR